MSERINEREPTDTPPTPLLAKEPRPDRLGIIHLLLWTGATAVLLAIIREDRFLPSDGERGVVDNLLKVLGSMLAGAALASLAAFGIRWWRGLPPISQPGQGRLLLLGSGVCVSVSIRFVFLFIEDEYAQAWQTWLHITFDSLFDLCICVFLLLGVCMEWRWRVAFIITAGACLLRLAMALLSLPPGYFLEDLAGLTFNPWTTLLWIVFLLILATWDIVVQARRDWLHWVGIGVSLAHSVTSFCFYCLFWFRPR